MDDVMVDFNISRSDPAARTRAAHTFTTGGTLGQPGDAGRSGERPGITDAHTRAPHRVTIHRNISTCDPRHGLSGHARKGSPIDHCVINDK